jgi:hypothetical protein
MKNQCETQATVGKQFNSFNSEVEAKFRNVPVSGYFAVVVRVRI